MPPPPHQDAVCPGCSLGAGIGVAWFATYLPPPPCTHVCCLSPSPFLACPVSLCMALKVCSDFFGTLVCPPVRIPAVDVMCRSGTCGVLNNRCYGRWWVHMRGRRDLRGDGLRQMRSCQHSRQCGWTLAYRYSNAHTGLCVLITILLCLGHVAPTAPPPAPSSAMRLVVCRQRLFIGIGRVVR